MNNRSQKPEARRQNSDGPSWPLWYRRMFMTRDEKDALDRKTFRGLCPERFTEAKA